MKTPIRDTESVMAMQVCFVTDDIERTLAFFGDIIGKPTPEIGKEPPVELARPRYLGEDTNIGFRQAAFTWRNTIIEFIEPDQTPSAWRDWLDRHGPSVHHLGFTVPDMDAASESLTEAGVPTLQDGHFPGGRYAYTDSEKQLGTLIELLEIDPAAVPEDSK
ncbi:MAG: VOC family protein [Beutenbergiaceae bacterium]